MAQQCLTGLDARNNGWRGRGGCLAALDAGLDILGVELTRAAGAAVASLARVPVHSAAVGLPKKYKVISSAVV